MFMCVLMYDYISTLMVINVCMCFDMIIFLKSYIMLCVLMYDYISTLIVI